MSGDIDVPTLRAQEPQIGYRGLGTRQDHEIGVPRHRATLADEDERHGRLGGERVEAATRRWALLPPQGLLELINRYESEAKPDPKQCAGLRAHLERMAIKSSSS